MILNYCGNHSYKMTYDMTTDFVRLTSSQTILSDKYHISLELEFYVQLLTRTVYVRTVPIMNIVVTKPVNIRTSLIIIIR
mgnify:CR=1 FL=1|jgi:hypothetical protein